MKRLATFSKGAGVRPAVIGLVAVLFTGWPLCAQKARRDPDEGTLSSVKPRIPEPMVFDLVRPLGAEKGELEINSLFRYNPANEPGQLLWAPEIEYTFAEGYGIELELPLENAGIDAYKAAIQGTLPGPWEKTFIHGWQAIGETMRKEGRTDIDMLYLAGVRLNREWSVFSMTGVRQEREHENALAYIGNYSLFYRLSKNLTGGFETNFKGKGLHGRDTMLMPQLHIRKSRTNVQVGAGWAKRGHEHGLQIAGRISREF